ncbi:MAG: F0F1 ATP synthase subunit B [Gammaproteobacteria bacterium AqS3]|nr:F0F1 ATP synthase subunit B [Gammaproteobacteria bacterium AqS3]
MNINLTLLGQAIAFTVLVAMCMRYIWPVLRTMLDERAARIEEGLAASDAAVVELERARQEGEQIREQARQEASEIVAAANRRANQRLDEAKGRAEAEAARIVEEANAEVDLAVRQAREDLRKELSDLVVDGSEKLLGDELAHSDAQKRLLKRLAEGGARG